MSAVWQAGAFVVSLLVPVVVVRAVWRFEADVRDAQARVVWSEAMRVAGRAQARDPETIRFQVAYRAATGRGGRHHLKGS